MATITPITPTNPGWRIQLAIHRAVRRDLSRLELALADGGEVPADAIRAYWQVTSDQLHHHHEFEDAVIWPLLAERLGGRVDALVSRNAHEHQVMAATMDQVGAALAAMTSDPAPSRQALGRMRQATETHLAHEEADVLPLIPEAFTMEDIAFFQAEDAKTNKADVFLPWMLDDAPEEDYSFFTGHMPAPVRENLESVWTAKRLQVVETLGLGAAVASA